MNQSYEIRMCAAPTSIAARLGRPDLRWFVAVLLSLCGLAHGALIEIKDPVKDPLHRHGDSFLAKAATGNASDYFPLMPAGFAHAMISPSLGHLPSPSPQNAATQRAVFETPQNDLFVAMDAPYMTDGNIDLAEPPVPEFWTIVIVISGLAAYQLRRKSRVGAIRVPSGRL